ncbi:MAG: TonB-dependent receptor [Rubrivivax sp.]|nr:TonB-dependent receptor [Rubrivivax sp.]
MPKRLDAEGRPWPEARLQTAWALIGLLALGPVMAQTEQPAQTPAAAPAPPPPPASPPPSAASPAGPSATAPAAPATQRIEIRAETASDSEQRRRDPVARTVVGREELDKFNDPSVLDVLKRQPGVNLSGGNPRLRGMGAGYTLILVNGERAPPGFSLDNLPPSQVERIEITKGPTAEHSTQAVAGTINVILRAAARQRQRELSGRVSYSRHRPAGGFNANWADRLGELSVALPLSGFQWAGGQDTQGSRLTRDTAGLLQRIAYDGQDHWWGGGFNFGPRLNWRVSDRTTLEWSSWLQRNESGSAGSYLNRVLEGSTPASLDDSYRQRGYWQNLRTGLSLNQRFEAGARLEARAGLQATRNGWNNRSLGLDAQGRQTVDRLSTGRVQEDGASSSGKFTLPWGESHTLASGWDVERRTRREERSVTENGLPQLQGFEARPFDAEVQRWAAYLQDEWQIAPRWSAYVGVRSETLQTTSRDEGQTLRSRSEVVTPVMHLQHRLNEKGRDLLRMSLTRSYKAPDLNALMARPSINGNFPASGPNVALSPDRVGNPALQPELTTGIDLALETYLPRGGVISAGLFHRRVQGLIRQQLAEEAVAWSPVPRWVQRPVNLRDARSTGLELELKGRIDELWPAAPLPGAMNLRSTLSLYHSRVDDIPGPDNRLEGQQPWTFGFGLDHRWAGTPWGAGFGFQFTPGYRTQLSATQRRTINRARNLDGYVSFAVHKDLIVRLSGHNLPRAHFATLSETQEADGTRLFDEQRRVQPFGVNLGVSAKF